MLTTIRCQSIGYTSRRSSNRGVVENPCDLRELLDRVTSTEQLEGKVHLLKLKKTIEIFLVLISTLVLVNVLNHEMANS